VQVREVYISGVAANYAGAAAGAWIALVNSWGLLEVAVNRDNAQRRIGAKIGDRIRVVMPGQRIGVYP
jgi:S-adenosylmethionine hydrolase